MAVFNINANELILDGFRGLAIQKTFVKYHQSILNMLQAALDILKAFML
jgi:hypothetical protein